MKFYEILQHCNSSSSKLNSVKISHHALQSDMHCHVKRFHDHFGYMQQLFFKIFQGTVG